MFKILALVLALSAAPLAFANSAVAVDAGDFAAQRAQIEKGLADGKTYAEISSADLAQVRESLDRISAMLEGGKAPEALPADKQVDLYNTQEIINTLLTQAAADSRVVCERSKATGSNRYVSTCQTVAQRNARREQDLKVLRENQRVIGPVNN